MEPSSQPSSEQSELRAWVALSLCASGRPDLWLAVARDLGGPVAAATAGDEDLAAREIAPATIAVLREAWASSAPRVLERCARLGIRVSGYGSADYPALLAEIRDAPLALFWRGIAPAECAPAVAVVGARRCTDYGERTAERIAAEMAAAGIVVVSGLARGVDVAAHRGALSRGRTAAVLAGGLDRIYPGEHRSVAERIERSGGCLLSEQPPGVRPLPYLFPYRNRIITGLGLATVVVEASARSGSLASARHALDQGRDVFAVPGPIDSPASEGTNRLIAQGAALFSRTADLAALGALAGLVEVKKPKHLKKKDIAGLGLGEGEAAVLTAIVAGAATADEIAEAAALDGTRVLALLTALELDGLVRREVHGRFRACPAGP